MIKFCSISAQLWQILNRQFCSVTIIELKQICSKFRISSLYELLFSNPTIRLLQSVQVQTCHGCINHKIVNRPLLQNYPTTSIEDFEKRFRLSFCCVPTFWQMYYLFCFVSTTFWQLLNNFHYFVIFYLILSHFQSNPIHYKSANRPCLKKL